MTGMGMTPGGWQPPPPWNEEQWRQWTHRAEAAGDSKGLFGALFDFRFEHFVTPKLVKVAYVLVTAFVVLSYLYVALASLAVSPGAGAVVLLLGWIPATLYLAFSRMALEFYLSVVRMSEDIHRRLPQP